jgi:hypothetical protein
MFQYTIITEGVVGELRSPYCVTPSGLWYYTTVNMSLYVLPDNQTLIWNSISKMPAFKRISNKEEWFQNIIRHFYNSTSFTGNKMTVDELRKMNRDTISYMIKELKQPVTFSNSVIQNQTSFLEPNSTESHSFLTEQKHEQLNANFTNRQQDYASMFNKPAVPDVNFKENDEEDKPIENMEELLQRQMKERSYDIQIPPPIEKNVLSNEKSVSFSDNISLNADVLSTSNETNKLDEFMAFVRSELTYLRNEIDTLKNVPYEQELHA